MIQRQWLALCGVVAAILVPLAFLVLSGNTPSETASGASVVSYYSANDFREKAAAIAVIVAAVLLVLFAAQLREVLHAHESGAGVLSLAAFGGGVLASAGLLSAVAVHLALVNTANDGLAEPARALNALDNYMIFAAFGGFAVLLLAAGITTVRRPALPRWLGWVAIVSGVLALPARLGVIGSALGLIWILVVGILIFRNDLVAKSAP
jgi:hypothetical protein